MTEKKSYKDRIIRVRNALFHTLFFVSRVSFASHPDFARSSLKRIRRWFALEDLQETIIEMEVPLSTLRLMHACAAQALEKWPGGDPEAQEHLMDLKRDLYVILMSALYETNEI